ncbi:hypothetical protein ACEWY4_002913 [Coilia grayii]|uniref:Uncharacterized protein n=1 Tax=Coilia grayii TaxID=363190 RepID=A0ABD1KPQ0_9TELE
MRKLPFADQTKTVIHFRGLHPGCSTDTEAHKHRRPPTHIQAPITPSFYGLTQLHRETKQPCLTLPSLSLSISFLFSPDLSLPFSPPSLSLSISLSLSLSPSLVLCLCQSLTQTLFFLSSPPYLPPMPSFSFLSCHKPLQASFWLIISQVKIPSLSPSPPPPPPLFLSRHNGGVVSRHLPVFMTHKVLHSLCLRVVYLGAFSSVTIRNLSIQQTDRVGELLA